jgi:RNA polymerase sigma-70 factor (ECF subfamily)
MTPSSDTVNEPETPAVGIDSGGGCLALAEPLHPPAGGVGGLGAEIEQFIPRLRRYAWALTRNADWADELVQDCLERAIGRQALWRGGNLRAWLFTIMHNIYANDVRKRVNRPDPLPMELVEGTHGRPGDQMDRMMAHDLSRALDALPSDQRAVILLVALEGMTYQEVADSLQIPIGTVMSRLSRARARLSAAIDGAATPPVRSD